MTKKQFEIAKTQMSRVIAQSLTEEDPSHAENTLYWTLRLRPNADEVLRLAAYGHDIERAMPDRLTPEAFDTYNEYKQAHAVRAGKIAADIAKSVGYSNEDCNRLAMIIRQAEFSSEDADVQLICDADSISYFDNNARYYLAKRGKEATHKKMHFMYTRASRRAQSAIQEVIAEKPELNLLNL
jgi:hypothetical protein